LTVIHRERVTGEALFAGDGERGSRIEATGQQYHRTSFGHRDRPHLPGRLRATRKAAMSGLVDPTATEHGALGLHGEEARRVDREQIVIPDDEVSEHTRLEGALDALFECGISAVHRRTANRLLDGNTLVRAPGVT